MNDQPFSASSDVCEASQAELSDLADSGLNVSAELRAHIAHCDDCARFAAAWLPGPPTVLTAPIAIPALASLREQILAATMLPPNAVRFPVPATRSIFARQWLGRIAAGLALAGFSYWLLNPKLAPVARPRTARLPSPLSESFVQMEAQTQQEQKLLETAVVEGGREVRGNMDWATSALDL